MAFLHWLKRCLAIGLGSIAPVAASELPAGFIYLRDANPGIPQDIRYAGSHNFLGRPVDGYAANACILSARAVVALEKVQAALVADGLSLLVWDCYRPARAVADFKAWSADETDQIAKAEFYPRTAKASFFKQGYLASRSGHSRGSTIDLGIVPLAAAGLAPETVGALAACTAPRGERYDDHTIDFGTGYDCLDPISSFADPSVSSQARQHRKLLRDLMAGAGFKPYDKEWWHFQLADEPFPSQYFDFPVAPRTE